MDQTSPRTTVAGKLPLGRNELIALAAALMALNALAIDIMLPGLQEIGASLGEPDENRRQLVITAYITGFGLAQLVFGPLSDRFGRRNPLLAGLVVYVIAAFACAVSPTFGALLILRFVQGMGAAATRVIAISVIRDIFGGRAMAEVMSLVFMVFMVVPVIAPGVGQVVMLFANWHWIFVFIGVMSTLVLVWTAMRLPETLRPENTRAFTVTSIMNGFRIVLTNRVAVCYTAALTFVFGALFGFINSAQQIYVGLYGVGAWFPVFFGVVAGFMAISSYLNARLVGRFGMRKLAHGALLGFLAVTTLGFVLALLGPVPLWLFTIVYALAMVQFAWIGANFNSLAMEPLGHVAGTASSVQGFLQTAGGGLIGAMIGQSFDGTIRAFSAGYFFAGLFALALVLVAERGRLFQAQNEPPQHG
ncbi:multidrug effflux MFS transporter [Aliihoeflea sp. PC F10.4]